MSRPITKTTSPVEALDPDQHLLSLEGTQERYWFLDQYEEDPSVVTRSTILELRGEFSDEAVADAVRSTVRRHPILTLQFLSTKHGLRCRQSRDGLALVEVNDAQPDDEIALRRIIASKQRQRLNLRTGQVCAFHLIRAGNRSLICIRLHSCVGDIRSLRLLAVELAIVLQNGTKTGSAEIGHDDVDFLSTTKTTDSPNRIEVDRYWTERIGQDPPPLDLPIRKVRPARKGYDAAAVDLRLSTSLANTVESFCQHNRVSVESFCFAAFLIVLQRWSQQEAVIVGRLVDRRTASQSCSIGPFEDVLPCRTEFIRGEGFLRFLRRIEANLKNDQAHQHLSFDALVKLLQNSRDPSRSPILQAMFRFVDSAPFTLSGEQRSFAEVRGYERLITPNDLEVEVNWAGSNHAVRLIFDPELFDSKTMERMAYHFRNVVTAVATDPEIDIGVVPLLDAAERHQQLEIYNDSAAYAPSRTIGELFSESARLRPSSPAVTHRGTTLSYAELDALTDRIASQLRSLGVGRDTCVGVCLERSVDMVATVLGILKAGGAYVPMDPTYPDDRLAVMAEDTHAELIVTRAETKLKLCTDSTVFAYDALLASLPLGATVPATKDLDPNALAYVIFTSGSTGRPKGVAMPHRSLVNLIEWQLGRSSFRPGARVLQYSSLSFDVSFQEMFSTWASGGQLFLIDDEARRDPRRLLDTLREHRIERLFLPYVALRQMVDAARATQRSPEHLREVITAGEQLRVDDAVRSFFAELPGASLDNQYGPSETHVVTAYLLENDPAHWPTLPPIGTPIRGNQAYILDPCGQLVPAGVSGELYLSGINVARGYFGRDDLTREKFIPDTFAHKRDALMYRTGDLARYRGDGSIDFLGRIDSQVKIRGYRIEPGEVNAVISRYPGVSQALTTIYDEANSGKRLATYVLVENLKEFSVTALSAFAKSQLPEFMVPTSIIPVTAFPFTPSGKVDTRALPQPHANASIRREDPIAPRNATESALAKVWSEILGINVASVTDSFFDLGGDSLQAVELFLAIDAQFGQDLPLSLLAENPTIATLAAIIDDGGRHDLDEFRSLRLIQRGDAATTVPLFFVHGGGGNVVLFRDLAANLPSRQPVYAFEWDGWSSFRGQTTIDAMADLYTKELMTFRPTGPYRLGGHCIGGLIAIEMARRLRAIGHAVQDPVIISDSPNLAASTHQSALPVAGSTGFDDLERLKVDLDQRLARCEPERSKVTRHGGTALKRSVTHQRIVRMASRVHGLYSDSRFDWNGFEARLDAWQVRLRLALSMRIPGELRPTYCGTTMIRAANTFRPTVYDGDILYFRTRVIVGTEMGLPGWWTDLYFGFGELCRGKFTTHFINASHNGVVGHPVTAELILAHTRSN